MNSFESKFLIIINFHPSDWQSSSTPTSRTSSTAFVQTEFFQKIFAEEYSEIIFEPIYVNFR